jgi:hypothetical protein
MHYEYFIKQDIHKNNKFNQKTNEKEYNDFVNKHKSYIIKTIYDIMEGKNVNNEKMNSIFEQLINEIKDKKNIEEKLIEDEKNYVDNNDYLEIETYKTLFIGGENKTKKQVISEIFKKS